MLDWLMPKPKPAGGGGFCTSLSLGGTGRCGEGLDNWIASVAGAPTRTLPSPSTGLDGGSDVTVVEGGGTNATGNVCNAALNACEGSCDNFYSTTIISCEHQRAAELGAAILPCIGAGALNHGLGLLCAGSAMLASSGLTYTCREQAWDVLSSCRVSCSGVHQACCAHPGTECGGRAG